MPASPVTRQRIIDRSSCILGFTGNALVLSMVFDATSLSPDSNGFYYVPAFSFVTPAVATDPTKIKVYQGLGSNVNAVQTITITGSPTGGTFTLTYAGQTTAPIAWNASAASVQAALAALTNIAAGNVACAGGALPGAAVTATFQGLLGNEPQPLMTAVSSLTGGTAPAVTVATTTVGQTAEHIVGVFDNLEYDFFGNAVGDDEPVPIYADWTTFDTTKLQNWLAYGATARSALPNCSFRP